jgi:hypothetical protein
MSDCQPTVIVEQSVNQVVQQPTTPAVTVSQTINATAQATASVVSATVVETETMELINDSVRTIEIDVPGLPGPPGPSASGVPPIAFSYGDASGAVFTAGEDGTIVLVRMSILTAFDGVGATLKLGTLAQPESILSAAQNDPSSTEEYENTPDLALSAGQSVILTIAPGTGAAHGNGTIYLVFNPD